MRGKGWLKIKKIVALDLVVVAADWGYGCRHGWLSNYHLAVRDAATGEFVPVGKTFKGLTDDQFRAMTERLLECIRVRQKLSNAYASSTLRTCIDWSTRSLFPASPASGQRGEAATAALWNVRQSCPK